MTVFILSKQFFYSNPPSLQIKERMLAERYSRGDCLDDVPVFVDVRGEEEDEEKMKKKKKKNSHGSK